MAAYPLLLLGLLYGQWLLSWWILGHPPLPLRDDPKYIVGASWMHPLTGLAILGFLPAGGGAVALTVFYVMNHRLRGFRLWAHVAAVGVLWGGTLALLFWDPWQVVYWWLD